MRNTDESIKITVLNFFEYVWGTLKHSRQNNQGRLALIISGNDEYVTMLIFREVIPSAAHNSKTASDLWAGKLMATLFPSW